MDILKRTLKTRNNVSIPIIGFGTWQIEPGDNAYNAVKDALEVGYRHIDTAHSYGNEKSVGLAIKDSNINREDIFVTSKLPSHIKDYDNTIKYFKETLSNLEMDYLDLYLIHAPWPWSDVGSDHKEGNVKAWTAIIDLYNEGLIKTIGVSNFSNEDIDYIYKHTNFYPHVNQIQFHIDIDQEAMLEYGNKHDILIEAYSPLGTGRVLNNEVLVEIANKYQVSPAQLAIKYTLERGTITLPKTVNKSRMIENSELDFIIEDEDLEVLKTIHLIK